MSRIRAIVFAAVVVGVSAAVMVGGWDLVRDADRVEAFLVDRGLLGPLVFVAAMWLIQPLGVPGVFFMVPAAVIWNPVLAISLSWIGNMGASTIAFGFARWLAHDWAQRHLPPTLHRWDARIEAGGVREVIVLRVLTGQLTPADWLLGVSSVRVRPFLIGTGIGIVPGVVVAVLVGGSLAGWLGAEPIRWGTALLGLACAVVVSRAIARRRASGARR